MKTSFVEALFWSASAGVYVCLAIIAARGKLVTTARPHVPALVVTVLLFASERIANSYWPEAISFNLIAIGFFAAFAWLVFHYIRDVAGKSPQDALLILLSLEALTPLLLIVIADFFSQNSAYQMRTLAAWICAAPVITVTVFLISALLMKTAPD